MTRINCVPPSELTRQHLVAEYRELPRVFGLAMKAYRRNDLGGPPVYTLGTGHVRFFYTRLGYLARRFKALVKEMQRRGYHTSYLEIFTTDMPICLMRSWKPTPEAMEINRARIVERNRGKTV